MVLDSLFDQALVLVSNDKLEDTLVLVLETGMYMVYDLVLDWALDVA